MEPCHHWWAYSDAPLEETGASVARGARDAPPLELHWEDSGRTKTEPGNPLDRWRGLIQMLTLVYGLFALLL